MNTEELSRRASEAVTREIMIVETAVDLVHLPTPALAFYPGEELQENSTNWFASNPQALCHMLKTVGFRPVEVVQGPRPLAYSLLRSVGRILRKGKSHLRSYQRDRVIVHAWK
jgi:hypothetical protein